MRTNCKMMVLGLLFFSFNAAAQRQLGGTVIYRVGERLPDEMFVDQNIVKNPSHYHVRKPQDGYEWLRGTDGNVLLVSMKSHVISKMEFRPNIPLETK